MDQTSLPRSKRIRPAKAARPMGGEKSRVRYVEAGGVTGVRRGCDVPLTDLPLSVRRGLRRVLAASPKGPGAARDLKTYRFTVASAGRTRDVLFDESSLPHEARPLVRYLSKRASAGWA